MNYIIKAPRRHGKWEYFMGWHKGKVVITLELSKAKHCNEWEANKMIEILSGPYTKYEKQIINK